MQRVRQQRQLEVLLAARDRVLRCLSEVDAHLEALRQATLAMSRALGPEAMPELTARCQQIYTACDELYREGWVVKLRLDFDGAWTQANAGIFVAFQLESAALVMEQKLLCHVPLEPDAVVPPPSRDQVVVAVREVAHAEAACLSIIYDLICAFRNHAAQLLLT